MAPFILKLRIGGRRVVSLTTRPTSAGVPVCAWMSAWTVLSGENELPLPGIEPGCFQAVAQTTVRDVCGWVIVDRGNEFDT